MIWGFGKGVLFALGTDVSPSLIADAWCRAFAIYGSTNRYSSRMPAAQVKRISSTGCLRHYFGSTLVASEQALSWC
jgi:hypothetical protein